MPVNDRDSGQAADAMLAKMIELQKQTADQIAEMRQQLKLQRATKSPRKRRGPVAYSPPNGNPGRPPTDIERAWAKRLLRQYGWK